MHVWLSRTRVAHSRVSPAATVVLSLSLSLALARYLSFSLFLSYLNYSRVEGAGSHRNSVLLPASPRASSSQNGVELYLVYTNTHTHAHIYTYTHMYVPGYPKQSGQVRRLILRLSAHAAATLTVIPAAFFVFRTRLFIIFDAREIAGPTAIERAPGRRRDGRSSPTAPGKFDRQSGRARALPLYLFNLLA